MLKTLALTVVAVTALGAAGCRKDPGKSKYDEQEPFGDGGLVNTGLPGPNPYVEGDLRLDVGAFYDGKSSQKIPIDNDKVNLFVYENSVLLASSTDHIEGHSSDQVTNSGATSKMPNLAWTGFGIHWQHEMTVYPRDMSMWTKMHVSMKSSDADFAGISVSIGVVLVAARVTGSSL